MLNGKLHFLCYEIHEWRLLEFNNKEDRMLSCSGIFLDDSDKNSHNSSIFLAHLL